MIEQQIIQKQHIYKIGSQTLLPKKDLKSFNSMKVLEFKSQTWICNPKFVQNKIVNIKQIEHMLQHLKISYKSIKLCIEKEYTFEEEVNNIVIYYNRQNDRAILSKIVQAVCLEGQSAVDLKLGLSLMLRTSTTNQQLKQYLLNNIVDVRQLIEVYQYLNNPEYPKL